MLTVQRKENHQDIVKVWQCNIYRTSLVMGKVTFDGNASWKDIVKLIYHTHVTKP